MLDLKDDERALVWVDSRFAWIVGPGQSVYWTDPREVRVERVKTRSPWFEHDDLKVICRNPSARERLEMGSVARVGCVGVVFLDGRYADIARAGPRGPSGRGVADVRVLGGRPSASSPSTFRAKRS